MYVSNLVIEITRRCNANCAHCLRGPAQRMNISRETITSIFSYVDRIGTLTLTGGEPSLKPGIIEEITNIIRWKHIELGSFYIATNGKSMYRREEFLDACDTLYMLSYEKEMCTLQVSNDEYHPDFKGYYEEDRPYVKTRLKKHYNIIPEGRARENGIATGKEQTQPPWIVRDEDEILEPVVYVSCNGNVLSNCDLSYKRIDSEAIGNINKDSLQTIVERNYVKEEEEAISN